MPFCPKCREEFREGFSICQDCNVALVAALENDEDPTQELAVVCSLTQEDVAYIIRGYLESEDIPCVLENATAHAIPAPAMALTRVRLWTQKSDVSRARDLINEHEQFNICSSCGHIAGVEDTSCDFCGEKFAD